MKFSIISVVYGINEILNNISYISFNDEVILIIKGVTCADMFIISNN